MEVYDETFSEEKAERLSSLPESLNLDSDTDSDSSIEEYDLDSLEAKVAENQFHYQAHLDLVTACRRSGEFERLQKARQNMQKLFPLTPEMWIDWVNDEKQFGTEASEIKKLFELAVQDYLSVELWLEYALWSSSNCTAEEARSVFERAVQASGLHVADGLLVWEAYRQFELTLLEDMGNEAKRKDGEEDQQEAGKDDLSSKTIEEQRQRLRKVFVRELGIPLLEMDQGMEDYVRAFGQEAVDSALDYNYKKALKELNMLAPFEKQLKEAAPDTINVYLKYLDLEAALSNPARMQCLFERAVADHCLNENLWLRYVRWLDHELKFADASTRAYKRALRNCPWATRIWLEYVLSNERFGLHNEASIMASALEVGFSTASEAIELWLQHAYSTRRRLSPSGEAAVPVVQLIFRDGAAFLKEKFGDDGWDPDCYYRKCWAWYEAKHGNAEMFRKVRDSMLKEGNGRFASVWLDCIALERQFGDTQFARRLFQQAANSVSDFPEALYQSWLQFEREEGTLHDLDVATKKVAQYTERLEQRQTKTTTKPRKSNKRKQMDHKSSSASQPSVARAGNGSDSSAADASGAAPEKWPEGPTGQPAAAATVATGTPQSAKRDADGFAIPILPKKVKTLQEKPAPRSALANLSSRAISSTSDTDAASRTVFISNLDFRLTKERLQEVFEAVGEVGDVRLVMLRPDRNKGYCYVEFKDSCSVDEALKLDRHLIDGRPMFVSVCKGDRLRSEREGSSTSAFKFGTGEEKNKLFVKNVPRSATEAELEQLFKSYGKLVSVRLVTFRSGASKGLAYIEYEDVESAAKALEKTNGTYFHGKQLIVSISNPPPRKSDGRDSGKRFAKILKQAHFSVGDRETHSRERIQLLPRTLLRKEAAHPSGQSTEKAVLGNTTSSSA